MEAPPLIPERGEQFLPPPEGSSTFLDALIRSATHSEAQVFTEATPPFKICHANNAWSLLCGYSVPEVLGKTCKILQGPETDPDRLRDLHAGIAANCKTIVQLVNYTKSGERFLNELTVEPLRNQAGEVTHFIGSMNPVLLPASMSAAQSPLCGTLAADKLEKPPAALRHRGESSPARGAQGAAERAPGASWVVWANATLDPCLFKETPEGRVVGTGAADAKVPRPLAVLEETLAAAGPEGSLLGPPPADFSVADVAVAAYLLYIPQFFPDVHWGRLPATAAYMARCAARPAYSKAYGEPLAGSLVAKLEAQAAEGPQAPGPKLFGGLFSSQK